MDPKVSVIMPAYNSEKYISEAVASVLQGTLHNVQVIVVDDASTDATFHIASELAVADQRVEVYRHDKNRGPAVARNLALRHAKGEWVTFLDSDDWFAPERLERLVCAAEDRGVDAICDDIWLFSEADKRVIGSSYKNRGLCLEYYKLMSVADLVKLRLIAIQPLIRRSLIEKYNLSFPENYRYGEDYYLYFSLAAHDVLFCFDPRPMYFYRKHTNSITYNYGDHISETISMIKNLLDEPHIKSNYILVNIFNWLIKEEHILLSYIEFEKFVKNSNYAKSLYILMNKPEIFPMLLKRILSKLVVWFHKD